MKDGVGMSDVRWPASHVRTDRLNRSRERAESMSVFTGSMFHVNPEHPWASGGGEQRRHACKP
jgi:hypothetical protein